MDTDRTGKEPSGPSEETSPIALASEVAQEVELKHVLLRECCARHHPGQSGQELSVEMGVDAEAHLDNNLIVARIHTTVTAVPKITGDAEPVVEVTCAFDLVYSHPQATDIPEEKLAAFADLNAVYNAWPYIRELVQNTTSRMCIVPFVIPVFRL